MTLPFNCAQYLYHAEMLKWVGMCSGVWLAGSVYGGPQGGWTPEVSKLECNLLCISCNENIECD